MPQFTVEEVLMVTGARLLSGSPHGHIKRLCTDSRVVRSGDLFIALKGDRFDGHQFVEAAVRGGAVGAMVGEGYKGLRAEAFSRRGRTRAAAAPSILRVSDPLTAFQALAVYHRSRFQIPVVAVTGSNGKTSTKEMLARVLAERWSVLKTQGNLNNRIGVPQTLLRLTPRHQAAVVELGVDQKGQTARLCEVARPTIGLITNIGPDHLEFLGTVQASAEAKAELLDLLPTDGAAVLNADDPYFEYLASRARCRVLSFGFAQAAEVRGAGPVPVGPRGMAFELMLPGRMRSTRVVLSTRGLHNLSNALAAAAVGHLLGVSAAGIARGLSRFRPAPMRSQVRCYGRITIINDCYNANPASMKAAIDMLTELSLGRRTIAVLGDMLELGLQAEALHREIGGYLARCGVSSLIACGGVGRGFAEGAREAGMEADRIYQVRDAIDAAAILKAVVRSGDVVLVKGSRGMRMERIIEGLTGGRSSPPAA